MKYLTALTFIILAGCTSRPDREANAYATMIDSKVRAGQMTKEEGEYLKAKSWREAGEANARFFQKMNSDTNINVDVHQ